MAGDAYFKLECSDNTEHIESRLKELYNGNKNETSLPFIDWDSIKWHDMDDHCILVSKEFPNTTIIIHKKENDWDLWGNPSGGGLALVARQADNLEDVAVRVVEIGAWAVYSAALPVFFEKHIDTV